MHTKLCQFPWQNSAKIDSVSSTLQNEPYIEEHACAADFSFLHFNPPVVFIKIIVFIIYYNLLKLMSITS